MPSTRNASSGTIQHGAPVAFVGSGLAPASGANPAIGIALGGGPPGRVISWSNTGEVALSNWSLVTGAINLTPGVPYYVAGTGRLDTSGTQQVGFATSATTLTISIQNPASQLVQIHLVSGPPPAGTGTIGDLAYDGAKGNFWGPKTASGWPATPKKLVSVAYDPTGAPVVATPTQNGWQVCS
jgi:hypothetical protein